MIQKPRLGITIIAFFVCQLFFLAAVPVVSMGQSFFDTNGNGFIEDEELVLIINAWAQGKPNPDAPSITLKLPGDVPLVLVNIPSGEGLVQGNTVHVNHFWMGKFEITQAQWQALMGGNPSYFKDPNKPVERVTWYNCQSFINKLNALDIGHFSLPSASQWEYACRAGTKTAHFWGNSDNQTGLYSWYHNNSGDTTHVVGTREPNPWGLYDMTGNVYEWCKDRHPTSSNMIIILGSSWHSWPGKYMYPDYYGGVTPNYGKNDDAFGLRVVWTP